MEHCPKCGAELAAGDPEGLCAMCLFAGGIETEFTSSQPTIAADLAETVHSLEYDSFGRYTILRVLGEGGMGTVYLAEQTNPIRRQVALKVVKLGMDTSQVVSRFNYERQSVAMMDHPNIARVYDADITEKGRPYFVMEYVDGVSITQYCDRHRLNTQERLQLFIPVCQAVQHAHQKGVIHRDIKPTNVMVTEKDGRPVPKVIDFGIARATDQNVAEKTAFTLLGQFVGTPEYMSPEQADVMTGDIDTSSDVYSLGILLYELLVGAVPFDGATLRKAGLAELLRIVREEEAPAMHSKLTSMGKTATEVAERRRTDPVSLKRQVGGDLNWIVSKAVEKNRQRRYASVSDLSADISRHLEDKPVLASPPSRIYQARKFVRRNRAAVLAAAAVFVALIGGLAATAWEAGVANRERARAERGQAEAVRERAEAVAQKSLAEARSREALAERARAEEQAGVATRQEKLAEQQRAVAESRLDDVSTLANSMFSELDDDVKELAGSTKAREALTRLGLQYLNKMSAQSGGSGQLRSQLGAAYLKVGELQGSPGRSNLRDVNGARESYAKSMAILEGQLRANPKNSELRHLYTIACLRRAQFEESDAEQQAGYDRALQLAEKLATDEPKNVQAQSDLAEVLLAKEEPRRAVEIMERVVAAAPTSSAQWELSRAQVAMGTSLRFKQDDQALDWLTKGLAGLDALGRQEPANVQYKRDRAEALSVIGTLMMRLNRFDEGVSRSRQAVAIQEELTAADPRNAGFRLDLSNYQSLLGWALFFKGDSTEALEVSAKALAVQEQQAAEHPENPDFLLQAGKIRNLMGNLASDSGDANTAITQQREAERIFRQLVRQHPEQKTYARALAHLLPDVGDAALDAGDSSAAVVIYREAVASLQRLANARAPVEEDMIALADAHAALSRGLFALRQTDEAIAEDRAAIALYERIIAGNPNARSTHSGSPPSLFATIVESRERIGRPQAINQSLSQTWSHLSTLYNSRADWSSAVDASLRALPFAEADYAAHPGDPHATLVLARVLFPLRYQYGYLGDYEREIEVSRRSVEIAEKSASLQPSDLSRAALVNNSLANLSADLELAGRRADSLTVIRQLNASLDRTPMEKIDSAPFRYAFARYYLYVMIGLRRWDEQAQALPLFKRVVPVLEALVKSEPANQNYRTDLVLAYQTTAAISSDLDDLPTSIDYRRRRIAFQMERPVETAVFWNTEGRYALSTAEILSLAGQQGEARKTRNDSLDIFRRARGIAEKARTGQGRNTSVNLAALQDLLNANEWSAVALEQLGNREEALQYRKAALANAIELVRLDPATPSYANLREDSLAQAVRLESAIAGSKADFTSISALDNPSERRIRWLLARGWRAWVTELSTNATRAPVLPEAIRAVEAFRALAAENPADSMRELGLALQRLSLAYEHMALGKSGDELATLAAQAKKYGIESRDILSGLRERGSLAGDDAAVLNLALRQIANADAKLSVLQSAQR